MLKFTRLQPRARNFPRKNPKKVGKLRAPWKIMSILQNYTNFGITLQTQKVMTPFTGKIVVKNLIYTYAT